MNLKAISPVIATVIIVSVAIAIAVAVAFWMTGITGLFTRYEKLEIVSAYATTGASSPYKWILNITVRNTGTTDVTVDSIFINGKPLSEWSGYVSITGSLPTLTTGDQSNIILYIKEEAGKFTSGQIIEVKLHTAAGNEYPKSVQLP